MLGIRLDPETEQRLDAYSSAQKRTRSSVVREAITEFLQRHSLDAVLQAQLAALAAAERDDGETDAWLRMLDEADGGYDWGPEGPPL